MKKLLLTAAITLTLQGLALADEPPQTATTTASRTYHGVNVPDPYAWLEKGDDPKVKAWIEAQNSYAEKELSGYAGREALAKRISELSLTPATRFAPRVVEQTLFFMKETPPSPQPVLMVADWPNGEEKVLVNTNNDEHPAAITEFWPSPSGKYVAYGTAVGGSELTSNK